MLGSGSLFYTSEEATYAVEETKRFNGGVTPSSADHEDIIPYYLIPSSRPSFKVNSLRRNFMRSGFRTFSDEIEKGVGEVTGSFDIALSDSGGTKKILQLFMGLEADTLGVADWTTSSSIKSPTNGVKSMTIYQTYPNNTSLLSKFTGMCINSLSLSIPGNETYPIVSLNFLGKNEEFVPATGSLSNFYDKTKVIYEFNDVFPVWATKLEFEKATNDWQQVFMYDFNFNINNNLSFPQYSADDRTHSRKPVAIIREVTGSFSLVGTDETPARIDDIALLLNKIKNNTPIRLRLKIQDQKEEDYFQFNMDKVYMLSGGVFDSIDYGELRIPISFIAEDGADDGKDYTIKYGRNS